MCSSDVAKPIWDSCSGRDEAALTGQHCVCMLLEGAAEGARGAASTHFSRNTRYGAELKEKWRQLTNKSTFRDIDASLAQRLVSRSELVAQDFVTGLHCSILMIRCPFPASENRFKIVGTYYYHKTLSISAEFSDAFGSDG